MYLQRRVIPFFLLSCEKFPEIYYNLKTDVSAMSVLESILTKIKGLMRFAKLLVLK